MITPKAAAALNALAEAYRGDWSDFDGRTLKGQLQDWLERAGNADLEEGDTFDLEAYLESCGIEMDEYGAKWEGCSW